MAEVRRLVRRLVLDRLPSRDAVLSWADWRRHHQAVAQQCHYQERNCVVPEHLQL